jgi:hypothetical protein
MAEGASVECCASSLQGRQIMISMNAAAHSCRLTAALFLPNSNLLLPLQAADASQSHGGADVSRAKEGLSTDLSPLIGTTRHFVVRVTQR